MRNRLHVILVLLAGCCGPTQELRDGLGRYSVVIDRSAAFVNQAELLDDPKNWTSFDGVVDRQKCLAYEQMADVFRQGMPAIAKTLAQWSKGEPVTVFARTARPSRCGP